MEEGKLFPELKIATVFMKNTRKFFPCLGSSVKYSDTGFMGLISKVHAQESLVHIRMCLLGNGYHIW